LTQQLAQKEAELVALLAPGKKPPPAAVVGRLRDDVLALQAAIDGAPPPPVYVSAEAAEAAAARAAAARGPASRAGATPVPRLLRPGSSARMVGGGYGGEQDAPLKTPGGLPPGARRAVPPGGPTPVFALATVVGRLVPCGAPGGRGGAGARKAK